MSRMSDTDIDRKAADPGPAIVLYSGKDYVSVNDLGEISGTGPGPALRPWLIMHSLDRFAASLRQALRSDPGLFA